MGGVSLGVLGVSALEQGHDETQKAYLGDLRHLLVCLLSYCFLQVEISPPGGRRETHKAQGVKETNKDQEVSQTYTIQQAPA